MYQYHTQCHSCDAQGVTYWTDRRNGGIGAPHVLWTACSRHYSELRNAAAQAIRDTEETIKSRK